MTTPASPRLGSISSLLVLGFLAIGFASLFVWSGSGRALAGCLSLTGLFGYGLSRFLAMRGLDRQRGHDAHERVRAAERRHASRWPVFVASALLLVGAFLLVLRPPG